MRTSKSVIDGRCSPCRDICALEALFEKVLDRLQVIRFDKLLYPRLVLVFFAHRKNVDPRSVRTLASGPT